MTQIFLPTALLLAILSPVARAYDNGSPLAATAPRGWNSWSTLDISGLLDLCFEEEVHQVADAMVSSGMVSLGYNLVELDDCWSSTNRTLSPTEGELQPDPARFPSGIPALVSYLNALNLSLGLYTCAGTKTCKYNRPGSYGHYEQDAQTMADWGVKWIKADNCASPGGAPRTYFSNFSSAINKTNVPMVFQSCEWGLDDVVEWGPGVTQVYRVRPDHLPFWWFNLPSAYPPGGQGTGDIIEGMADPAVLAGQGPYSYPDPDVIHTGLFQTNAETITEFSFWSLWGAPLLMATDPRNMSDFKKSVVLNAEVLEVQRGAERWGYGAKRVRGGGNTSDPQVWVKGIAPTTTSKNGIVGKVGGGQEAVIILYNPGDWASVDIQVGWEELGMGWGAGTRLDGYDLWEHAPVFSGKDTGAVALNVPSHGIAMWRLIVNTTNTLYSLDTTLASATTTAAASTTTPPTIPGYTLVPELSDEFEGEGGLDESKWCSIPGCLHWPGRQPGLFDPTNVVVQGGALQLWARSAHRNSSWPPGYDNYTTSAIHSKATIHQGYFEIKWKSGSSAISSSWWFHNNNGSAWTEIDVFETTGVDNTGKKGGALAAMLPSHMHVFSLPGVPPQDLPTVCGGCKESTPGVPPCSKPAYYTLPDPGDSFAREWHVAGLNWTDGGVTISLDGVVVSSIQSPCFGEELGMDFDRETMPGWMALPDPATLPDVPFMVEYVRAYRRG